MRFASILVVTAAFCAACTNPGPVIELGDAGVDTTDAGVDEAPAFQNAADYCELLAPVFCPFYVRCGRMAVDDEAACLAAFAPSCEARFEPRFAPLAAAGSVKLSTSGIETCAAHLETVSCDEQFLELSGPCASVWEGQVPAGGACGLDVETFVCAPGTSCTLDLSFCGVCESVVDVGQACSADGLSCGTTGQCIDGVCAARPATGEACTADGPSCVLPARCDDAGVCREPAVVDVGDACDSSHRCPYRSTCNAGTCVATVGPGSACDVDSDCDGSFCSAGACTLLRAGGEACDRPAVCGSGVCTDGVCVAYAPSCTVP